MKTQHTPGPWKLRSECDAGQGYTYTIEQANGPAIIADTWSRGPDWNKPTEEGAANARLIIAAPELLEALMLLLAGAESAQKQGVVQPQLNGGVILARAAIAKATGEKP